jgi:hypothetical protein
MKGFLIGLTVTIFLIAGIAMWGIGVSNSEIRLRERISAQQENCEIFYTKLWEILRSQAGVADRYAEKFKEIQVEVMEGRYSSGGEMMMWIQEAGVSLTPDLYMKLMNSIEGERNGFFVEQKKLIDMNLQHGVMLKTFPSKLIIGSRPVIDITVLRNAATVDAYETGVDTSPTLF